MSISIHTYTERELIIRAQNSNCSNELLELSKNFYSNVRRCVAKNTYTKASIIDRLALDPVANVTFAAISNNKCSVQREEFDTSNKCVTCTKDEATFYFECGKCNSL